MSTDIIIKKNDFACPNQIKKFLEVLDFVYDDASTGQHEMLDIFMDFEELVDKLEDSTYIREYIDLQVGRKPITPEEMQFTEIEQVCARRLGIRIDGYKHRLNKSIEELAEFGEEKKWLINNPIISYSDNEIDEVINKNTKANQGIYRETQKRTTTRHEAQERSKELEELIAYRDQLQARVREIQPEIRVIKDSADGLTNKDYDEDIREEYRVLSNEIIELTKDINFQRKSLGESFSNNNQQGRTTRVSYEDVFDEIHQKEVEKRHLVKDEQVKDAEINKQINHVFKVAETVLTKRQSLILKMYYIEEMTQAEIGEIYGIAHQNVHKSLKRSISKLQDFFRVQR